MNAAALIENQQNCRMLEAAADIKMAMAAIRDTGATIISVMTFYPADPVIMVDRPIRELAIDTESLEVIQRGSRKEIHGAKWYNCHVRWEASP